MLTSDTQMQNAPEELMRDLIPIMSQVAPMVRTSDWTDRPLSAAEILIEQAETLPQSEEFPIKIAAGNSMPEDVDLKRMIEDLYPHLMHLFGEH